MDEIIHVQTFVSTLFTVFISIFSDTEDQSDDLEVEDFSFSDGDKSLTNNEYAGLFAIANIYLLDLYTVLRTNVNSMDEYYSSQFLASLDYTLFDTLINENSYNLIEDSYELNYLLSEYIQFFFSFFLHFLKSFDLFWNFFVFSSLKIGSLNLNYFQDNFFFFSETFFLYLSFLKSFFLFIDDLFTVIEYASNLVNLWQNSIEIFSFEN